MEEVCEYPERCRKCGGVLVFVSGGLLLCMSCSKYEGAYFSYFRGKHSVLHKISKI
ncbi:MAG: hypothetical protein ABIB47_02690 [Candidatus Woesearchaeota archaeon]